MLGMGLWGASAHARLASDPPGNCVFMDFNNNRKVPGVNELTVLQKSPNCTSVQSFSRREEFEKFLSDWRAKNGQDYPIQSIVLSGHAYGDSYCSGNLSIENFGEIINQYPDSFAKTSGMVLLGCYAGAHMRHWREGLPSFSLGLGFEASSPLQAQGSPAWLARAERKRAALPATLNEEAAQHFVEDLDTLGGNSSFTLGYVEDVNGKKIFKRLGRKSGCNEALDRIYAATGEWSLDGYLKQFSMQIENNRLLPPKKEAPPDRGNTPLREAYGQLQFVLANLDTCRKIFSPPKFARLFGFLPDETLNLVPVETLKKTIKPFRDRFITLIHSQMVAENFRVCAGPWLNAVAHKLSNCEPYDRKSAALVRKFLGIPNGKPPARTALYTFLDVRNSDLRPLVQATTAVLTADSFVGYSWEKPLGTYKDPACKTFEFMNLQAPALTKCQKGVYPEFWTPWTEPQIEPPAQERLPTQPAELPTAPHTQK